jgi:hypothetical protein
LALAMAVLSSAPAAARELNTGIWQVMRDGGFSGPFDADEVQVSPIGDMDVGRWRYRFMTYDYRESKRHMVPGGVPHGHNEILVFERARKGLVYLGGYWTWGGRPRIVGHTLVFPYKDPLGMHVDRTVVFDEKGPPPSILLDGEVFQFRK